MRIVLLLASLVLPCLAFAQSPDAPVVRTAIDPPDGVVIGQAVGVAVTVLFPGDMARPPLVTLPDAPGAQVFRFGTQGVTVREQIDGRDYVGQTFEFTLYPRRGGDIVIPAPKVTLLDRAGEHVGAIAGTASKVSVTVPPGIDASGPVLVADRVEVRQDWAPAPGSTLKAGDAVVRTITRSADGVPALAMAEFAYAAPEGVRVYADPPVSTDSVNRGEVTGHRTDKVTYVFERAGSYDLPVLAQPWWSLSGKQARAETLPGISVTVAALPAKAAVRHYPGAPWIVRGLALLAVLGVITLGVIACSRGWRKRRERYRASADFARRDLIRAASSGDPAAAYRALRDWRERLTVAELAALDADPVFRPPHQRLLAAIFAQSGDWGPEEGRALSEAVAAWRPPSDGTAGIEVLPPLNPADPDSALREPEVPAAAVATSRRLT